MAINENLEYILVKTSLNESYIFAKNRISFIEACGVKIESIEDVNPRTLKGLTYQPLSIFSSDETSERLIFHADYVVDNVGTGNLFFYLKRYSTYCSSSWNGRLFIMQKTFDRTK